MRAENRAKRSDHILDVAIEVLSERGYRDANMLEVARRARASKETLYAWFGDKRGLFEAVIKRNARSVQEVMAEQFESDAALPDALDAFGRALLPLLAGDSTVALNRAAISEASSDPQFAETLAAAGRQATLPAFMGFLEAHAARGTLDLSSPAEAAEDYLGLLLGDLQIRRLHGIIAAPGEAEIKARAEAATAKFLRLYGDQAGRTLS